MAMAGAWIKMRTDLVDDPAVIAIANATGLSEDTVVGKLHRLWSWADRHTVDGNARSVTEKWIDRFLGVDGYANAMVGAGWLHNDGTNISFPKFDRHNSQSAKSRALTAKRVARSKGNARSVKNALPREEKRRIKESKPKKARNTQADAQPTFKIPTVEEVAAYCLERGNGIDAQDFVDNYNRVGWVVGRNHTPMKCWKSAVHTWERERKKQTAPTESRLLSADEKKRVTLETLQTGMLADA